jgi:hypothetical protein
MNKSSTATSAYRTGDASLDVRPITPAIRAGRAICTAASDPKRHSSSTEL